MTKNIEAQLASKGFEVTAQGDVLLSGVAKKVYNVWSSIIQNTFSSKDIQMQLNPLLIDESTLDISKYTEHFPHHIMQVTPRMGDSLPQYCTPASCLHVYRQHKDQKMLNNQSFFVSGSCGRYESGKWSFPFRLPFFTMSEYVMIGTEVEVKEERERIAIIVAELLKKYNIESRCEYATDAFFSAENSGAQIIQKMKGLKKEYSAIVNDTPVALASINYHEDYFGNNFKIESQDGLPAFSLCVAFGIERLVAFSLLSWGEYKNWPIEFTHEQIS